MAGDANRAAGRPLSAAGADPAIHALIEAAADVPVLKALLRISDAVLRSIGFDDALEAIAEQALTAVQATSVSISQWERDRNVLRTLINVGNLAQGEQRWPTDEFYEIDGDSVMTDLLIGGRSYINCLDDDQCPPQSRELLESLGRECELGVPIMVGDSMWGEIWVSATDGRRFDHSDAQLVQAIAAYTAVAIGRSELLTTAWTFAFQDPLTGIANRRAVGRTFEDIDWERFCPVALVCDLDGFKQINDTQGHPAGDRLLCDVADVLARVASSTVGALAARLGGDEFCLVIPHATVADAQDLANHATHEIREAVGGVVTLSWGVASAGPGIRTGDDLLKAADAALIEAKRHGPAHLSSVVLTDGIPGDHRRSSHFRRGPEWLCESVVQILCDNPELSEMESLEVLAVQMQRAVGTCAYALSVVTEDGTALVTPRKVDIVRDSDSGLAILTDLGVDGGELADYPDSAKAIDTATTFLAAQDLPGSETAEIALLDKLGYQAVLGVGVHGSQHRYLVEFYSNSGYESLAAVAPLVQVLSVYCVARYRAH